MEYFAYILLAIGAFSTTFLMGWQFGLYLQGLADTKAMRNLYSDEKADFYNDYYGEAKVKYGASDNLNHHKPKTKKPRKKK
jgi:hypothetical protein